MTLSVVFMGTPDFAVPTLSEIIGAGHDVTAVYTQPARPAGRGMAKRPSPVQQTAERFGLSVHTPEKLSEPEIQAAFATHQADVAVVVAYGLILPRPILAAPREGCLNLHASLLPRWRGSAPIQRAVMAGDAETGVSVMRMVEKLDAGPVCLEERVAIGSATTAGELHDQLARIGAGLMVRALAALSRGSLDCRDQREESVAYANKIDKAETRIDFSRPAGEVHDHVRGLSPQPGAWFGLGDDRVKVLRCETADGSGTPGTTLDDALTVACGEGAVRLIEVQRAGKGPMAAADFLRGQAVPAGTVLE